MIADSTWNYLFGDHAIGMGSKYVPTRFSKTIGKEVIKRRACTPNYLHITPYVYKQELEKQWKKVPYRVYKSATMGMPEGSCDQLQYQAHRKMDHKMRESAEKKKVELKKANEIAREHIPPRLSPRFIKKFPSPPPIFRSRRNSDNVPCLKIKLFFNGGSVVIQRFYCKSHVSKRRKQKGRVKIP